MDEKLIVKTEDEMRKWFIENYKNLGYDKIIENNKKSFPDFVVSKGNSNVRIELELLSSSFLVHKHDKNKVDQVICIVNDIDLGIPTKTLTQFEYSPKLKRVSATIDTTTMDMLNDLLKEDSLNFRNKSHAIEYCIKKFWGERYGKFRKDK